jgi:hypothetical protein
MTWQDTFWYTTARCVLVTTLPTLANALRPAFPNEAFEMDCSQDEIGGNMLIHRDPEQRDGAL